MKIMNLIWLAFFLFFGFKMYSEFNTLPAVFATHFNINGTPNGWQSKEFFYIFYGVISILNNLMVLFLSIYIKKIPVAYINIPRKDIWFSTAELKALAYERLRVVLATTGVFLNLVLLLAFEIIVGAASAKPNISVNQMMVIILIVTIIFLIFVFRVCRLPANAIQGRLN